MTAPSVLCLVAVAGYLIGSIPFGYLLGKAMGNDLLASGSKSTGATNALRTLGPGPAVLTLVLDAGKAMVAIAIARRLMTAFAQPWNSMPWVSIAAVVAAASVIIGHSWSVFLRFRGGKSVAASAGSALMLIPTLLPYGVAVFILTVAITRYVSLGSILGTLTVVIAALVTPEPLEIKAFIVIVASIIIYRHRANIGRLLSGTENRFGSRAKR